MKLFSREKNEDGEVFPQLPSADGNIPIGVNLDREEGEDLEGNIEFGAASGRRNFQRAQPPTFSYGILDAIQLMRELPQGELEVVVTVVKKTLESMNVALSDIVEDAEHREQEIQQKTEQLEQEISDLESQILQRKGEISELNDEAKETALVKYQLKLAEYLEKSRHLPTESEDSGRNQEELPGCEGIDNEARAEDDSPMQSPASDESSSTFEQAFDATASTMDADSPTLNRLEETKNSDPPQTGP